MHQIANYIINEQAAPDIARILQTREKAFYYSLSSSTINKTGQSKRMLRQLKTAGTKSTTANSRNCKQSKVTAALDKRGEISGRKPAVCIGATSAHAGCISVVRAVRGEKEVG